MLRVKSSLESMSIMSCEYLLCAFFLIDHRLFRYFCITSRAFERGVNIFGVLTYGSFCCYFEVWSKFPVVLVLFSLGVIPYSESLRSLWLFISKLITGDPSLVLKSTFKEDLALVSFARNVYVLFWKGISVKRGLIVRCLFDFCELREF
jgi:hypothetical protein